MRRLLRWGVLAGLVGCGSLDQPAIPPPTPTSLVLAIPPTATPVPLPRTRTALPIIPAADPRAVGRADAPVTIIEYSDFECPYCQQHATSVYPQIKAAYVDTGKVRYVFRNYIEVPQHTAAPAAAIASLCAAQQDQFWPMHDRLFATQADWAASPDQATSMFREYASAGQLDPARFAACLNDPALPEQLKAEIHEAQQLGARGTPAFFVNNLYLYGARSYQGFVAAIDQALSLR